VTVFHLLRHGEHLSARGLAGRMPGVGLSERGRAEIAAVAERLAGERVAAIYASPFRAPARAPPPGSGWASSFATI
jgi:broad specificity phosphatase PhoE